MPQGKPFDAVAMGLNAVDHIIVVPHYPEFNSKVRFSSHVVAPGGQAATAMVALARLGLRARYIGKVGSDQMGQLQIESLRSEGVRADISIVEGAQTQTAFIIVDQSSGERTIIWDRPDELAIREDEVDREAVTSGRVLHLDGHDTLAAAAAARHARQAGIPVVIDIDNIYPGAAELLRLVDFVISSSTFPERFTGEGDLKVALKRLHEMTGSRFVAATLGDRGALAYFRGQYIYSPAFRIECRDTTGAGDAFHGGFIYGLLKGFSVEETLRFANAVAALKCRKLGARTALPSLAEVEQLLSSGSQY